MRRFICPLETVIPFHFQKKDFTQLAQTKQKNILISLYGMKLDETHS